MNDRFKFRIFISDKKNSKNSLTGMFKVHSLHTGTNKAIISSLYGNVSIKLDNNILMQSTGLKDKNGKLIYEGDIVKSFHVSSTMQGRVFTGFVAYDDERCRYCILENQHCGYVTFSDIDDVFEVIGNIYENKELLNA